MFVSNLSSFRYIETYGETLEIPFQSLEIAAVSQRKEKTISPWEKMSNLIEGRDTQGWEKLLEIPEKRIRSGWVTNQLMKEFRRQTRRSFVHFKKPSTIWDICMKIKWLWLKKKKKGYPTWCVIVHQIYLSAIGRPSRSWR